MIERLAVWQDAFYEGSRYAVRTVHPATVISQIYCDFITTYDENKAIFREDSFDPVTRIRRGRLYVDKTSIHRWDQVKIDTHNNTYNWGNLRPTASYESWQPSNNEKIDGSIIQIGTGGFETKWRIVGLEKIYIGHILLTLRANSLLGVIPELSDTITDKDGNIVDVKPVQTALGSLVDAFHRQQATPTVDVARETAKVILTAWIGRTVHGDDLGDVIKKIPGNKSLVNWVASIVNRLHPRGKSAEQEKRAADGIMLRPVVDEDAEVSVHLIGMLLREIGWLRP
ncbi:MAG: hypothetical protein ACYCT9_08780 [Leptospirillum sp.]|jgi:hypothetical protein